MKPSVVANIWLLTAPVAALAAQFTDAFEAAGESEKAVLCVPLLTKASGVIEMSKKAPSTFAPGDSNSRKAQALFQIMYRAAALDAVLSKTNREAIDKAWKASADDEQLWAGSTTHTYVNKCIAVYDSLAANGHIPKATESAAITEARTKSSAWMARTTSPTTCNHKGLDVCAIAKQVAHKMQQALPLAMSKTMRITEVYALGPTLGMHAALSYSEQHLADTARQNQTSMEAIRNAMTDSTKANYCQMNGTGEFLRAGGVLRVVYKFSDGKIFGEFEASDCHLR